MAVQAELLRKNPSGVLIPWLLNADGTDPVADAAALAKLETIRALLASVLSVQGTVTLDSASLAALENTTVTFTNGTIELGATSLAALESVIAQVSGTVELGASTLAALESITVTGAVTVSGTVGVNNFPATQTVAGTVAVSNLPATQPVSGSVAVSNFPASQAQALTDTQLRAAAVAVSLGRTLTERMLAKAPGTGFSIWFDVVDTTYIYIAEAPTADAGTATTFQGIRVPKDVTSGAPLGKVQIATAFAWDSRSAATWA